MISSIEIVAFHDERVQEILGGSPMTDKEREFLVKDTPWFDECDQSEAQLRAMADVELLVYAYGVWTQYALHQSPQPVGAI